MAREKSDIEYQVVTVRFPKEIYQQYKKILKSEGKIPTYDLRNYIFSVVDEYEKGQRWVQKVLLQSLKIKYKVYNPSCS